MGPADEIQTLSWCCLDQTFACGPRSLVAGVVNVTPDSFSDGGRFLAPEQAARQARAMAEAGADLIDVGGESSRPGAYPVPLEEELSRVLPALEAIREVCDVPLSVDTTKAEVARQALERGVVVINDISALRADPEMARVAAESGAGVVLMHMQGRPRSMQTRPHYADVVGEVEKFFEERVAAAEAAGIRRDCLCLDPGIGFGKRLEDNLALLCASWRFRQTGLPAMVGASRKSFIGMVVDCPVAERL